MSETNTLESLRNLKNLRGLYAVMLYYTSLV